MHCVFRLPSWFTILPRPRRHLYTSLSLSLLHERNLDGDCKTLQKLQKRKQRITNDVLPSTTHRVVPPEDQREVRTSFPMASYVRENEVLEVLPIPSLGVPKYPPIRAIDFHTSVMSKYYGDDYRKSGTDADTVSKL